MHQRRLRMRVDNGESASCENHVSFRRQLRRKTRMPRRAEIVRQMRFPALILKNALICGCGRLRWRL